MDGRMDGWLYGVKMQIQFFLSWLVSLRPAALLRWWAGSVWSARSVPPLAHWGWRWTRRHSVLRRTREGGWREKPKWDYSENRRGERSHYYKEACKGGASSWATENTLHAESSEKRGFQRIQWTSGESMTQKVMQLIAGVCIQATWPTYTTYIFLLTLTFV